MAGSGVNVGGTAMLRTRRRDVSIKPNRRLDRKSSRGMIYENEELRLRTININAEVEQGQNDIKKLRRENEQLRREIWSLRDEYDKLEELVKNQSSHGSSDELEGRSGEENNVEDVYTEYSGDEDVVEEEEEEEEEEGEGEEDEEVEEGEEGEEAIPEDGKSQEEHLENAENQKISSEKMNSSLHRLHVEFDDLSVVDEEEEVKKDKEKKDSILSDDSNLRTGSELISIEKNNPNTKPNDVNLAYFNSSSSFGLRPSDLSASEQKYFTDCPFIFPNPSDPNYPKMLPMDNSNLLMSPCSKMYNGQLTPLPNLDTPAMGPVETIFGNSEFTDHNNTNIPNYEALINFNNSSSLPQRRNIRFNKQPGNFFDDDQLLKINSSAVEETPNSGDAVTQNGWDFSRPSEPSGLINGLNSREKGSCSEKPKHFFAPLPSKLLRPQRTVEETFSKGLDTATSSSSDKTTSTVISRNNHQLNNNIVRKGAADVYVNGGFPFNSGTNNTDMNFFQSSENVVVEGEYRDQELVNISRQSSNNPLIKSLSCQDLSTDPQCSLTFSEKLKMFNAGNYGITKSDNTLDNFYSTNESSRPFKSQLNVTLKLPKHNIVIPESPDTPEIPRLPLINYRLFNNPFLHNYQNHQNPTSYNANYNVECPMTRPLSIQVNEDPRNPVNFKPRIEDPRLLLMAANQYRNIEENADSRRPNLGFEVTSFEGPNPRTLLTPANPLLQNQRLHQQQYQNIPNGHIAVFPSNLGITNPSKVPAQTQTSIDGDNLQADETDKKSSSVKENQVQTAVSGSPLTLRRKRTLQRKERPGSVKDKRPLSPAAQRRKDRLRKQNSVTSSEPPESPVKTPLRGRKFSVTTSTSTGEVHEKNESRSSSSGQDSPKKIDQRRRVSLYFNAKKRPSLVSTTKMDRRSSADNIKDGRLYSARTDPHDANATTTNSERERTNSVSSRDTVTKGRKMSTGSGKVPWCACWGNGCV